MNLFRLAGRRTRAAVLALVLAATLAAPVRAAPNRVAAAAVPHGPRPGGQALPLGATGPASFDCSGLVRFAYADAGLSLPRTSRQQWSAGQHVRVVDLRPGGLVF